MYQEFLKSIMAPCTNSAVCTTANPPPPPPILNPKATVMRKQPTIRRRVMILQAHSVTTVLYTYYTV